MYRVHINEHTHQYRTHIHDIYMYIKNVYKQFPSPASMDGLNVYDGDGLDHKDPFSWKSNPGADSRPQDPYEGIWLYIHVSVYIYVFLYVLCMNINK
jgi:hypothetical protein